MLTFAAVAMLGAKLAMTNCTLLSGANQLWQPSTRWVVVGEQYGTNETPDAFANLVCLAAATGRPVTVALEYSRDWQSAIDAWVVSKHGVNHVEVTGQDRSAARWL